MNSDSANRGNIKIQTLFGTYLSNISTAILSPHSVSSLNCGNYSQPHKECLHIFRWSHRVIIVTYVLVHRMANDKIAEAREILLLSTFMRPYKFLFSIKSHWNRCVLNGFVLYSIWLYSPLLSLSRTQAHTQTHLHNPHCKLPTMGQTKCLDIYDVCIYMSIPLAHRSHNRWLSRRAKVILFLNLSYETNSYTQTECVWCCCCPRFTIWNFKCQVTHVSVAYSIFPLT